MKQQVRVPAVQSTTKAIIGISLLILGISPAMARQTYIDGAVSNSPGDYPGAPKPVSDTDSSPYAMNYADEAAQAIGVRNGHVDVFTAQPAENQSYMPVFSGGVGGDGAMLKLQWHPGE